MSLISTKNVLPNFFHPAHEVVVPEEDPCCCCEDVEPVVPDFKDPELVFPYDPVHFTRGHELDVSWTCAKPLPFCDEQDIAVLDDEPIDVDALLEPIPEPTVEETEPLPELQEEEPELEEEEPELEEEEAEEKEEKPKKEQKKAETKKEDDEEEEDSEEPEEETTTKEDDEEEEDSEEPEEAASEEEDGKKKEKAQKKETAEEKEGEESEEVTVSVDDLFADEVADLDAVVDTFEQFNLCGDVYLPLL